MTSHGGMSTQFGAEIHRLVGILKLIETYNNTLSRVIIETPDDDKSDIRCFPTDPNTYSSCDGSCGLDNAYKCENWQIKSKPSDNHWTNSEIGNLVSVVTDICTQATPILALHGEYSRITLQHWENNPNVQRFHDIEYIESKFEGTLSKGNFDLSRYNDILKEFSDFYIRTLKKEKHIDATTERLRKEILFPHEFWKGKVPPHIDHAENVLIINQTVPREVIGNIPINEGCRIGEIYSDDLDSLKQHPVRCRASSLVSIFDSDPETIEFVEELCNHSNSGVKLVISSDEGNLLLNSKSINASVPRPHKGLPNIIEEIKLDITHYQRLWRIIHAEGM